MSRQRWSSLGARLGRSALAASLASPLVAVADTCWLARASDEPLRRTELGRALAADAGLIAPLALLLGVAAGLTSLALAPSAPPSLVRSVRTLREAARGRSADVAALAPLVVLACFLWTTAAAQLGKSLLALEAPAAWLGLGLGAGSLGLGLCLGLLTLALVPPLRRRLACASERQPLWVDPAFTGGLGLLLCGLLLALGVRAGGLSGEGAFLGIYGVFRRPELDLRAPTLLLALGLAGFFGPSLSSRPRGLRSLALALAPLALTLYAASSLQASEALTSSLERSAPLGRLALRPLRALADRDHDGASSLFGGGDCDDRDASVSPLAAELPNNGRDEDCSGTDLILDLDPRAPASTHQEKGPQEAGAPRPPLPSDLSLVLITVDTLRPDLGFLGYGRSVSPNLDKLAARSTVFERAYSLASYTGKSVGPLLIGKYGCETHRNWGHFNKFGPEDTFLAERLKKAGYRTLAVHGHRYFGGFGGLDRGFDVVDMSAAPPESAAWDASHGSSSAQLADAALRLLSSPETASGKFFLWVHFLDPHADYEAHDDVPTFGKDQRALYDGEVAFTDKHIGRILDAISQGPRASKTAIVFTSDHGEAFGEHGMVRHGFELWEPLVRVPLLVHVPGASPSRVQVRRSAIDLVPTFLELAGVPLPGEGQAGAGSTDDFVSGSSLLADVFARPGVAHATRDVLLDMPGGPYNDPRRGLIRGDLKLIEVNGSRREVYDLAADPGEKRNLSGKPEAKELEERWARAKASLREIRVTGARK